MIDYLKPGPTSQDYFYRIWLVFDKQGNEIMSILFMLQNNKDHVTVERFWRQTTFDFAENTITGCKTHWYVPSFSTKAY